MKRNLENLENVVKELNAPKHFDAFEIDGTYFEEEDIESNFDFVIEYNVDHIRIYDKNECYSISYLDEQNGLSRDCAEEFGYEFKPQTEDKIFNKLQNAIKEDLGSEYYLDWSTNVSMVIGY